MKRLILVPLLLATACGSQTGATSTVTAPPKTVHVKDATASISNSACKEAMEELIATEGKTLDAATNALHFNYAKASAQMNDVTHRLKVVKPLVDLCRGG